MAAAAADSRPTSAQESRPSSARTQDSEREEGEIYDESAGESQPPAPAPAPQVHPLEHAWTFWFDNPEAKRGSHSWGITIRAVHTFSTVEDFWRLYNNINTPSKLTTGADFYCFKNKIEPKWEDPVCANGGKWTISCARGKSDIVWLYTLLAMIGEQFDHGDVICGAVVNVRKAQEKVAIWTKDAANEAAQVSVAKQWKELLDYKEPIGFIVHEDAKNSKNPRSQYNV